MLGLKNRLEITQQQQQAELFRASKIAGFFFFFIFRESLFLLQGVFFCCTKLAHACRDITGIVGVAWAISLVVVAGMVHIPGGIR